MDRTRVVVSRKWHEPQIEARVTNEEIGLSMSLADFLDALAVEIGSPAFMFRQAALKEQMKRAAEVVQQEIKDASVHVV